MSLIHTAELCGANSFDYLAERQRHARELADNPAVWMPWNYREVLQAHWSMMCLPGRKGIHSGSAGAGDAEPGGAGEQIDLLSGNLNYTANRIAEERYQQPWKMKCEYQLNLAATVRGRAASQGG